jgi:DNA-binding MarR family transcriptional regulator
MSDEAHWLSEDEQATWRNFIEGTNRLSRCLDEVLRTETGLTMDDYEILVHLSESPDGRARMSDLAERLLTSRSRLTYRVDGLETRDLVCRSRCPDDGRAIHALITDAGWKKLRAAAPIHVNSVREHLLDHFDEDEFRRLGEQMKRLVDAQCEPEA